MRDRIVRAQSVSSYPFDSFFIPYTTTLSLNWPYAPNECLLPAANRTNKPSPTSSLSNGINSADRSPLGDSGNAVENALAGDDGEELLINPVFESHLRNLDNWSLGNAFRNAFPDLVDDVRIKDVKAPPPP